jgi:hypothetical protein
LVLLGEFASHILQLNFRFGFCQLSRSDFIIKVEMGQIDYNETVRPERTHPS